VSEPEDAAAHQPSLAVWDVTSPVVARRAATLKVGLACPSGCDLTGTHIDVRNEIGTRVGGGRLGSTPWPATIALYWTEIEVAAPEAEGEHVWGVEAAGQAHDPARSMVRFIAVRPPEHRVTLKAIEKGTAVPLAGVELRVGVFRVATNEAGIAQIDVPRGTYEVFAWKIGYDLLSRTAHVAADATIDLEVPVTVEPEQPYWM
jgi:hypothetical protein